MSLTKLEDAYRRRVPCLFFGCPLFECKGLSQRQRAIDFTVALVGSEETSPCAQGRR